MLPAKEPPRARRHFQCSARRTCAVASLAISLLLALGAIAGDAAAAWLSRAFFRGSAAGAVAAITFPQAPLPKHALCVLATFKNEALNLREWLEHYAWAGVDALLLLDNGSTDAWRAEVAGFENFATVLAAPAVHAQEENYNDFGRPWLLARGCEFVAVLDLDEFAFATPARSLRAAVVDAFTHAGAGVSQLLCPWLMFGSSGRVAHPVGGVRTNFTLRAAAPHELTKAFVRLGDLGRFHIHSHDVTGATAPCPPTIRLNHYAIQSREYFERVKMTRGDAAAEMYEGRRNAAYFKSYDFAEERDETLRDLVLGAQAAKS